jgi:type IV secretory pathway TraG/TraD family ATPase VirD4/DNA-binding protein H-NS
MTTRLATAEWADPAEFEKRFLYREGSIWLGRSASTDGVPLGYKDDRHVTLVSGNRGGKGTTSIVNSLLVWPGSVVVIDPKGENATLTAARRAAGQAPFGGLGQQVHVLDPFKAARLGSDHRSRFNPFDTLRADSEESIDDAGRIADALVIINESNDPFWDESARDMVKTLILHILTDPSFEGRRNLVTLRKLIARGDWEVVKILRDQGETEIPSAQGLLWTGVGRNPAFDGLVSGAGERYRDLLLNSSKTFQGVLQVANRNTEFIDSPGMQRCLSGSDFRLSDLKTAKGGVSLYLCLPSRYMSTHHRWLRMMTTLIVNEMESNQGKPATGHQVLMVLDEFAGLMRMKVIENAVAQIAGAGLKLFFVLQSLEQLKAIYKDNWETFLANSGLKMFFNIEDHFTREYVSKFIGETEIVRNVQNSSDATGETDSHTENTSKSRNESEATSTSEATARSEGSNWSDGDSKSTSINISKGSGGGSSWSLDNKFHFRRNHENDSTSFNSSQSDSKGTTDGESESHSKGGSRGTSLTSNEGRSHTDGTSIGESAGTTKGTSATQTKGESETIQRRPLIHPDEIGQLFASVSDRERAAYPGLGLILISGERPAMVRRVNYYEDLFFIGLFNRHPDFGGAVHTHLFELYERTRILIKPYTDLTVSSWLKTGDIARGGDTLSYVFAGDKLVANITTPIPGKIFRAERAFAIMYYSDSPEPFLPGDPFSELSLYCRKRLALENEKRREEEERQRQKEIRERQAKQKEMSELAERLFGLHDSPFLSGLGSAKKASPRPPSILTLPPTTSASRTGTGSTPKLVQDYLNTLTSPTNRASKPRHEETEPPRKSLAMQVKGFFRRVFQRLRS